MYRHCPRILHCKAWYSNNEPSLPHPFSQSFIVPAAGAATALRSYSSPTLSSSTFRSLGIVNCHEQVKPLDRPIHQATQGPPFLSSTSQCLPALRRLVFSRLARLSLACCPRSFAPSNGLDSFQRLTLAPKARPNHKLELKPTHHQHEHDDPRCLPQPTKSPNSRGLPRLASCFPPPTATDASAASDPSRPLLCAHSAPRASKLGPDLIFMRLLRTFL
jgi:hypothetical protein